MVEPVGEILFKGEAFSLYSQVALFDVKNRESYPQWKTGEEIVVFGQYGVAVATASDQQVEVTVYRGKVNLQSALCVSGEILVGNQGVHVGNLAAATLTEIPLKAGRYSIVVYTDGVGTSTKRVSFLVNRLGNKQDKVSINVMDLMNAQTS